MAVATVVLYAPARHHQFLFVDDNQYVTENPVVRRGLSWSGVAWAFSALDVANWHPLTWLSHMLDVELFGLDAGAHHLVNVGFHAANAALLLLVLARMTGRLGPSLFVAAVFAVHPLHVESVAWISERKDVLSTFFGLLMLVAYARYAERPRATRYALVVAGLALSLMAKPMWVTAPFLLLLLDVWPLRRVAGLSTPSEPAEAGAPSYPFPRLVLEKLPLVALSAGASAMAVLAQRRGGAIVGLQLGFADRVANAAVSYVAYLGKTFWPVSLAAFYPHPGGSLPLWQSAGAGLLLLGITAFALFRWRSTPWLAVGWFWFVGTLVPVIGLVQVGMQGRADRYTYVPMIGLLLAIAWGADELARTVPRRVLAGLGGAAVAILSVVTTRQLAHWSDQVSLFEHAVAVTGDNPRAQLFLAQGLAQQGRYPEAVVHAREAVRLSPGDARAHKNLGYFLYRIGELDPAIEQLETAVALDPGYAEAHGNLAIVYGRKGWTEKAMQQMSLEMTLRAASRVHD